MTCWFRGCYLYHQTNKAFMLLWQMFVYLYTDYFFNLTDGPYTHDPSSVEHFYVCARCRGTLARVHSWWLHTCIGSPGDRRRRRASPASDRHWHHASQVILTCVLADCRRVSPCDQCRADQLEFSHASPGIFLLYMHVYRKNLLPFLFFPKWLNLCRVQAYVWLVLKFYFCVYICMCMCDLFWFFYIYT